MNFNQGTTPLIAAGQGYGGLRGEGIRMVVPTEAGAVDAVKLLLERGLDVNAVSATGNTACMRPWDVVASCASRRLLCCDSCIPAPGRVIRPHHDEATRFLLLAHSNDQGPMLNAQR